MQALLSARSVMKELAERGVSPQDRLSHCSSPGDSARVVAVHEACERLSAQLQELGREPVLPTRSQVCQPAIPNLKPLLMTAEHILVHCYGWREPSKLQCREGCHAMLTGCAVMFSPESLALTVSC